MFEFALKPVVFEQYSSMGHLTHVRQPGVPALASGIYFEIHSLPDTSSVEKKPLHNMNQELNLSTFASPNICSIPN